jgi:hypothetical protein
VLTLLEDTVSDKMNIETETNLNEVEEGKSNAVAMGRRRAR